MPTAPEHPFWQDTPQTTYGVRGEPLPYDVASDDVLTALLLGCLLTVLLVARHWQTAAGRVAMVVVTCLILAVLCYLRIESEGTQLLFTSRHTVLWVAAGATAAYFVAKAVVQAAVNGVFFSAGQCRRWMTDYWQTVAGMGLALLPLAAAPVLIPALTATGARVSTGYVLAAVVAAKIWSTWRAWGIFFKGSGSRWQIILYLCALEMTPALLLAGAMAMTLDCLKLNY